MDSISVSNNIQLSPALFQTWIQLLEGVLNDHASVGIDPDQWNALLLESFEPNGLEQLSPLQSMTHRCGVLRDVVRWGIENNRQPISLDDLGRTIFSSRSTISQSCREQIRLQQVRLPTTSAFKAAIISPVTTAICLGKLPDSPWPAARLRSSLLQESAPSRFRWPKGPRSPWPSGNDRPETCSQR